jgi:hypothetical protein
MKLSISFANLAAENKCITVINYEYKMKIVAFIEESKIIEKILRPFPPNLLIKMKREIFGRAIFLRRMLMRCSME